MDETLTIKRTVNGFILSWKEEVDPGKFVMKDWVIQFDSDGDNIDRYVKLCKFIGNYFGIVNEDVEFTVTK